MLTAMGLVLEPVPLLDPEARALTAALDAEMSAAYPDEDACRFKLHDEELGPGRGTFLVAREAGAPVGCGAVRLLDDGRAEVKRMYVLPERRGEGVGYALLTALEAFAAEHGVRTVVIETGSRLTQAVAMYERAGYSPIPPWGEYIDSPTSLCMGRELP